MNIALTCKSPISDNVVLALASINGHRKSLFLSFTKLLYAVSYHLPLLTSPTQLFSGTYLLNLLCLLTTRFLYRSSLESLIRVASKVGKSYTTTSIFSVHLHR